MLKNSSTVAVSVPMILFIKLDIVYVKRSQGNLLCGRATYSWEPLFGH